MSEADKVLMDLAAFGTAFVRYDPDGSVYIDPGRLFFLGDETSGELCIEEPCNPSSWDITPYAELDAEGRAKRDELARNRAAVKQAETDRRLREALAGATNVAGDDYEYYFGATTYSYSLPDNDQVDTDNGFSPMPAAALKDWPFH